MGESSGKEGKVDHIKLFRSKYSNMFFMLWRDKQIHLPWKPLKVQWEKREKKCNTYKHIIKLVLAKNSYFACHSLPSTQPSFFSHYHICRTEAYRSGHAKTMSSIQTSPTGADVSADMFTASLLYLSRPKPGTSADYLNYLQWLLARELNMPEKLSQGYRKINPSLCTFNMFWRPFSITF